MIAGLESSNVHCKPDPLAADVVMRPLDEFHGKPRGGYASLSPSSAIPIFDSR
jgi:hypothetical protein